MSSEWGVLCVISAKMIPQEDVFCNVAALFVCPLHKQTRPQKYLCMRFLCNSYKRRCRRKKDGKECIFLDTDIKAKRDNMISELFTFRIAKAKANAKFGAKYLLEHECERSSVPMNINTKVKETKY